MNTLSIKVSGELSNLYLSIQVEYFQHCNALLFSQEVKKSPSTLDFNNAVKSLKLTFRSVLAQTLWTCYFRK